MFEIRDYSSLHQLAPDWAGSRFNVMQQFIDAAWNALHNAGVSWIGFYLGPGQHMDDGRIVGANEMLLGPCRDKPACSPIGLHGACGRSWREQTTLVVTDVKHLGANYVACDPRDQSELVIPLFDGQRNCWGVLDIDSFDIGAFGEEDVEALDPILERARLTHAQYSRGVLVTI